MSFGVTGDIRTTASMAPASVDCSIVHRNEEGRIRLSAAAPAHRFKVRAQAAYQAPSRAIARELVAVKVARLRPIAIIKG